MDEVVFMGRPYPRDAERVWSHGVDPTVADFESLLGMPKLVAVNVNTSNTTDEHLAVLGRMTALEDLDLSLTKVTDAGMKLLWPLARLQHLRIKETALGDRTLVGLSHHPLLETLNVKSLAITEVGVRALARLPRLERVVFSHAAFPRAALGDLQHTLPKCEIVLDGIVLAKG